MTNSDTLVHNMDKILLTIKMTPDLKEKLQQIADREGLPVSKVVLGALASKYPELVDKIVRH